MKELPPNVWQTSLSEDDWNFHQIKNTKFEKEEWEPCLRRELHREKVQAAAGGKFPSQKIRVPARSQDAKIMRAKLAMGKRAGRLINPDWTSYLSRRKAQHWKQLPKAKFFKTSYIAMEWHTFVRPHGEKLNLDREYELDVPIWDGDGKTEIVPMKIPWGWRDEDIKCAFDEWIKECRPPELPEPPSLKLTGAGSRPRQAQSILKALAAWRLYQHYKGNRTMAYAHKGAYEYLGKTYENSSEWTDARKTVQSFLK